MWMAWKSQATTEAAVPAGNRKSYSQRVLIAFNVLTRLEKPFFKRECIVTTLTRTFVHSAAVTTERDRADKASRDIQQLKQPILLF